MSFAFTSIFKKTKLYIRREGSSSRGKKVSSRIEGTTQATVFLCRPIEWSFRSSPRKFTSTKLMGFPCLPESCHLISLQGFLRTQSLLPLSHGTSLLGISQTCSGNGMISLVTLLYHYLAVTYVCHFQIKKSGRKLL